MQTTINAETSPLQLQDLVNHETVRMTFYKRLAECFQPPVAELVISLEHLRELFDKLDADTGPVARMIEFIKKPHGLKSILVDFSRLFIGPYTVKAPPYGSVYLESDRRVMGDSTMDAVSHYEAAGLSMNDEFHEVPDHIRAELEFMYVLIFKEVRALTEGRSEDAALEFDRQTAFLENHIGAWVFDFAERITSHAQTDFYKNLAQACMRFISDEMSDLCNRSSCFISKDKGLNPEKEQKEGGFRQVFY